jgi:hypothetical protein
MRLIAILLAFCLAAPAAAQTPAERSRLDWVLQRGRLIFALDDAAAVTSDDLRAQRVTANSRGWTVERDGDALVVAYRGRVERGRVVSREIFPGGARPPLTPLQRRMAAARAAMEGFVYRRCARGGAPAKGGPHHPFARSPADRDPRLHVGLDRPSPLVGTGEPRRIWEVTRDHIRLADRSN